VLTNVELPGGLKEIGDGAFYKCMSLHAIVIPPFVKVIGKSAFFCCSELTNVELPEGLKRIEKETFYWCTSLHYIIIPPYVKVIGEEAFYKCSQLTNVEFPEGLQEIGEGVFYGCESLQAIIIPPSVTEIGKSAFCACSELSSVEYCEEIEEFVSGESMRDWWNHGVHERSPSTYCFFVQCNIPGRVGLLQATKWQFNVHEMLRRIPSVTIEDLSAYFEYINFKLSVYENLKDVPMLLERAIFQNKGILNTNTNIDDILNTDIVPGILSYITDG